MGLGKKFRGLKEKLKSKTPTSESSPSKTPSKSSYFGETYKQRAERKYGIKGAAFDEAKKQADQQENDWKEYKKEQIFKIFEPKNEYVSKRGSKSDVKHPTLAVGKNARMKDGRVVEVEFGRMREWYLLTLAPCKAFVEIPLQTEYEKALKGVRAQQKAKYGDKRGKSQAEYDQMKSVHEGAPSPAANMSNSESKSESSNKKEVEEKQEKYNVNTTEEGRKLFRSEWYLPPMSRSRMEKEGVIYWVAKEGAAEEEFEDDPEGQFTVTAERVVETIEEDKPLKGTNVDEPTAKNGVKLAMTDTLTNLHERYTKWSTREVVYQNTLKGTIEFMGGGDDKGKIVEEPPTNTSKEISFAPTITAYVFVGKRLKRQFAKKKLVKKYEEERKDYMREAIESGGA